MFRTLLVAVLLFACAGTRALAQPQTSPIECVVGKPRAIIDYYVEEVPGGGRAGKPYVWAYSCAQGLPFFVVPYCMVGHPHLFSTPEEVTRAVRETFPNFMQKFWRLPAAERNQQKRPVAECLPKEVMRAASPETVKLPLVVIPGAHHAPSLSMLSPTPQFPFSVAMSIETPEEEGLFEGVLLREHAARAWRYSKRLWFQVEAWWAACFFFLVFGMGVMYRLGVKLPNKPG